MNPPKSVIIVATKRVAFIRPRDRGAYAPDPYVALPVAALLELDGYQVTFIDSSTEDDPERKIESAAAGLACVGIDAQSSYSVVEALRVAAYIKKRYPQVPVVMFGYAASAIHTLMVQSPLVDVVVRGIPEHTFLTTLKRMEAGAPLAEVRGITYLEDGQIRINPNAGLEMDDTAPPVPYHLLNIEKYMITRGLTIYRGSVGCASQCSFCWFPLMYGKNFAAFSPQRVLQDLRNLDQKFGLKHVRFADQSFFASRKRVVDICDGLIGGGPAIRWRASGQVELLNAFDDELWGKMKASGCHLLTVGVETGSPTKLKLLHKKFSPEDVITLALRMRKFDIKLEVNLVFGLPGETEKDLEDTLDLLSRLRDIDGRTTMSYHYYTPMADSFLFREHRSEIELPATIESYVALSRRMGVPWAVSGYRNGKKLFYYIAAYTANRYQNEESRWKVFYRLHRQMARSRLRRGDFSLPWDWLAAKAVYALRQKRLWQTKYQIRL